MADIGCGLGLSAMSLVSQAVETYEKEGWSLRSPIKLDLFDVSSEHQQALQALANFVNTAYGQYFHVTAVQCDITQQPIAADFYNIILALNLMHYIPETKWSAALGNIVGGMQKSGMLFMTTDHCCGVEIGLPVCLQGMYGQAIAKRSSPFSIPFIIFFDRAVADKQKSCQVRNLGCISFLKKGGNIFLVLNISMTS